MIIDLDEAGSPPLEADHDVCIAGAGVAGIVLAVHLAAEGRRVLLLEGGGLDLSEDSQDLYKGRNVGHAYFDLDDTRLRYLGGSSNHWGGNCRMLDASDFRERSAFADGNWPIERSDLDPYLSAASAILGLESFPEDESLPGSEGRLKQVTFRLSPVRLKDKYLSFLRASERVTLLIHANLVDIRLDEDQGRVSRFLLCGYGRPETFEAKAHRFVLAMGGLENPRALLNANAQQPNGLGNANDLVGRYFMEHPNFDIGTFVFGADTGFNDTWRFWAPTPAFMDAKGVANCGLRLEPAEAAKESLLAAAKSSLKSVICSNDTATDLVRSIRPDYRCPAKPRRDLPYRWSAGAGYLRVLGEQVPNPNSRVVLVDEKDRFGRRRLALDWQLLPLDKQSIRAFALEVGAYFARQDLGRVKLDDWLLSEDATFPGFEDGHQVGSNHHMGTTRMGHTAAQGVVDGDCRVFGIDNLFIAGSSVFRTSGHANPTLSIVQLALRLGDRLLAET